MILKHCISSWKMRTELYPVDMFNPGRVLVGEFLSLLAITTTILQFVNHIGWFQGEEGE